MCWTPSANESSCPILPCSANSSPWSAPTTTSVREALAILLADKRFRYVVADGQIRTTDVVRHRENGLRAGHALLHHGGEGGGVLVSFGPNPDAAPDSVDARQIVWTPPSGIPPLPDIELSVPAGRLEDLDAGGRLIHWYSPAQNLLYATDSGAGFAPATRTP